MDESTYETFEEEFGTKLKEQPSAKPVAHICQTDMQATGNEKEKPQNSQDAAGPPRRKKSRAGSIGKALSTQTARQTDAPWEGITLNRCLLVAIAILLISSGFQRLHGALKTWRREEGSRRMEEDGERVKDSLALRRTGLSQDRTHWQPESSMWESLIRWVWEDKDEEDEHLARRTKAGMKGSRGGAGRAKHRDVAGSAGRKRENRKERRGRGRDEEEEGVMKRGSEKKREVGKQDEEEGERARKQRRSQMQEHQTATEVTSPTG